MLRKLSLALCLMAALTACSEEKAQPTLAPTPTPPIAGYTGPNIGSLSSVGQSEAGCTEEGGCKDEVSAPISVDDAPLPLTEQTIGAFRLGIPEGYSPITLPNEILITAVSAETLGGFNFSLRLASDEEIADLLARFDNPDVTIGTAVNTDSLKGHWMEVRNSGAIAILDGANGQKVFVESSANAQYWLAFRPTFKAMVESLEYAPSP